MNSKKKAIIYALMAAMLYGIQIPFSKLLEERLDPFFLAAFLYLGAGIGMLAVNAVQLRAAAGRREEPLDKKDFPYVFLMILLDIFAPILLLTGLTLTSAGNVSLLGNFEIVATAVLAAVLFHESVGKRLWVSILLITAASVILSAGDLSAVRLSPGSLLILLACVVWGVENNFTRRLSGKNPVQIVILKGCGSGLGALILAFIFGKLPGSVFYILLAAVLGFVAFGMSIYFYVKAQRELGAARTSAFYASAPFVGVFLSWIILQDKITWTFLLALLLMVAGTVFGISEKHSHMHVHISEVHEHFHSHNDGHHNHIHGCKVARNHRHSHTHEENRHNHPHTQNTHHRHTHK